MLKEAPKFGLALGGGAIRGIAHLGVIDVLMAENIAIHAVSGTSVGALVAAAFALHTPWPGADYFIRKVPSGLFKDILRVYHQHEAPPGLFHRFRDLLAWQKVLRRAAFSQAAFSNDELRQLLEIMLGSAHFEDTHIPLSIIATDLNTSSCVALKTGKLCDAVLASCAIPGIFPPIEIAGHNYIDGGTVRLVPVKVLKQHVDHVIAVDVSEQMAERTAGRSLHIAWLASSISVRQLRDIELREADVIIRATGFESLHDFDMSQLEHLLDLGRKAARAALPELKRMLGELN